MQQQSNEHVRQESHVLDTCAAAKNMCGSKVMNMCGRKVMYGRKVMCVIHVRQQKTCVAVNYEHVQQESHEHLRYLR